MALLVLDGAVVTRILQSRTHAALSKGSTIVAMPGIVRWGWASLIVIVTIAALGVLLSEGHAQ